VNQQVVQAVKMILHNISAAEILMFGGILFFGPILFRLLKRLKRWYFARHRRYRRKARRRLRTASTIGHGGHTINYLRQCDPYVFEEILLAALKKKGYRVKHNKRYSGDGGIDGRFRARLFGRWRLIQAKRYAGTVPTQMFIDFENVCRRRKTKGLFIHTGKTPKKVRENPQAFNHIHIISGSEIVRFVNPRQESRQAELIAAG
jgi:restriction system protein